MPRLVNSVPKYRKHRVSGQAVVTLGQKDHYLGPHGTKASKIAYDRLIGEWLANDRRPMVDDKQPTIVNLAAAFWRHTQKHYVKHGRPTCEQAGMKVVLRYLKEMYDSVPVADFSPASLKAIRDAMIEAGNSRGYINQNVSRIKHIFKWGVGELLVPETVYRAIATLEGLQEGKCGARETDPVGSVADAKVGATLPHLVAVVADMVRLQQFTGMRPGEVVLLRPCDVDRSETVWRYIPREHKMEHKKGLDRTVMIGPQGQAVLLPYLLRDATSHCFVNAACGRRYSTPTYRDAIHRACEKAFGFPPELRKRPKTETPEQRADRLKRDREWRAEHCWSPNQLRHNTGTNIRKEFGIEGSQVVLGHTKLSTTEIYAERDLNKAAAIMAQVG